MPTIRDQAIPIRLWDYSETSQTACLFCREHGLLRGLAKGSKREKSAFSGGLEMLTRGEIVAIVRPSADLANLIEWDLQRIYPGLRASLASHHAAMYMADLLYHAVTDQDPHPALFAALDTALESLSDDPGSRPGALHALARFQWSLITEIGYRPRLDEAPETPDAPLAFDPARGALVADPGPHSGAPVWRVRASTIALLQALERGAPTTPAERNSVERAGRLLSEYLRHVLDRELPTRALVYPAAGGGRSGAMPKSAGEGD